MKLHTSFQHTHSMRQSACFSMQHFSNKNSSHRHTACCYNKFRQYSMTEYKCVKRTYYSTHVELSEHSRIHIITIKFVQIQTTIHPISLDILTMNKWMHAPGSMYALVLRIRCLRAWIKPCVWIILCAAVMFQWEMNAINSIYDGPADILNFMDESASHFRNICRTKYTNISFRNRIIWYSYHRI